MLNIYKTNKIELISDLLAKELLINPPYLTENLKISIENYYLGKWIKDQITLRNDISALYEFQTLAEFTEEIIRNISKEIFTNLSETSTFSFIPLHKALPTKPKPTIATLIF